MFALHRANVTYCDSFFMADNPTNTKKAPQRPRSGKVKKERAFLTFLATNPHVDQVKKFLKSSLKVSQYLLLRELAINELAGNIPLFGQRHLGALRKESKCRLKRLADGTLSVNSLHLLYPILRILSLHALRHHDLHH